eukprot:874234-Pleurochrysis_carterae.AAC.3
MAGAAHYRRKIWCQRNKRKRKLKVQVEPMVATATAKQKRSFETTQKFGGKVEASAEEKRSRLKGAVDAVEAKLKAVRVENDALNARITALTRKLAGEHSTATEALELLRSMPAMYTQRVAGTGIR